MKLANGMSPEAGKNQSQLFQPQIPEFFGVSVVDFEAMYAEYLELCAAHGLSPRSRTAIMAEGSIEIVDE